MDTAERDRSVAAMRASRRQLSGVRQPTMAERLATLASHPDLERLGDMYGDGGPVTALEERVAGLSERVGTVAFELPLRDAGFVLPSWDELAAAVEAARAAGARVHLDGARIWESTPHLGRPLTEVAALADSVYVSFYKSLEGISGAALAGPSALASFAKTWRHRYGGALFQQWPAALAALHGLDTVLPRLAGCVAHARTVAAALAALPGARVNPDPPHTHQFQLWLPQPVDALRAAVLAQAEEDGDWFAGGWRATPAPGLSMTEITVAAPALELDAAAVTELGTRFLARVAAVS
jgi:hypothetical protein